MRRTFLLLIGLISSFALSAQVSKTVTTTAGNLTTALTISEKNSVTNLSINGTIDARDFKTMRDEMPLLSVLNFSGASIATYTGTEGPVETQNLTYQANSIPHYAFCTTSAYTGKKTLTSVVMPSGILSIGQNAFYDCSGLTSLTIPSSVTYFDSWAFSRAGNNLNITIPASVTSMSNFVFEVFNGTINVEAANPNFSSQDGVLFNKNKTILIQCPGSMAGTYSIPESVKKIRMNAFSHCKSLTGNFRIPSGVETIDSWAFRNCESIKNFIIPASVDTIQNGAFSECKGLTSIHVYDAVPIDISAKSWVFHLVDKKNCTLYVPYNTANAYRDATYWGDFLSIVEMTTECAAVNEFPYSEDFSSGQPYCWSVVDLIGNGQVWRFDNPGSVVVNTPTAQNGFAIIDSDNYGVSNNQSTSLITVPFDFSYYTHIDVGFSYYYKHFNSTAKFSYSINNGASWVDVLSLTSNSSNPTYYVDDMVSDLSSSLSGKSNVLFRWHYTGSYSFYWAVDDFWITADKLPVEENVTLGNVDVNSGDHFCANALNELTVAGYGFVVTIDDGAEANFIAGNTVRILPGFHAAQGSQVNAYISTDGNYCFENVVPVSPYIVSEKSSEWNESTIVNNGDKNEKTVQLYPNPTTGILTVELAEFDHATMSVFNMSGQKVFYLPSVESGKYSLDFTRFSKGLYFLNVTNGKDVRVQKFIVQ